MPRVPSESASVRRKMRKGTHSCFECRRRKIRCIFPPDNPDVCSECFARGSKCIDQEHADSDVVLDQRKNLRERVARLESMMDHLMQERQDKGSDKLDTLRPDAPRAGGLPPSPISSAQNSTLDQHPGCRSAPLLNMFDNDVLSRDQDAGQEKESLNTTQPPCKPVSFPLINGLTLDATCFASNSPGDNPELDDLSRITRAKQDRTRKALLSSLPDHDKMMQILRENGGWWDTWRTKTPGTCGRHTTLVQFAERVLPNGSIGELGTLVLSYGVSLDSEKDTVERYLALVDRLVTSDDDYAATLEGMECLVLQFKCYADIGQPRRAWLQVRRGVVFAQLMGLHRNHARTPATESIWWSLYQADRFLSLMLGVPYSIHDDHCDLTLPSPEDGNPSRNVGAFTLKIGQIAGKVIDRTQSRGEQSYSSALDLDQELEGLKSQLPAGWWDVNAGSLHIPLPELRERLLMQLCYNQVRVYLHLPFMLKSPGNSRYDFSRAACFDASREMLHLYHELRSGGAEPLYECKATDFIGFTGSIVLLLGLLGYGRFSPVQDTAQEEKDWRLIEISMDIFRRASSEKGGKVAAQSYRVLEQLSGVRKKSPEHLRSHNSGKVVVPYFGTISVRAGKNFTHPQDKGKAPANATPAASGNRHGKQNPPGNRHPSTSGSAISPHNLNPFSPSSESHIPAAADGSFHLTMGTSSAASSTSYQNRTPDTQETSLDDPFVAYDGLYMMPSADDAGMSGVESFASPPIQNQWTTTPGSETHNTWMGGAGGGAGLGGSAGTFNSFGGGFNPLANAPGMGPAVMDIDQDWSWFLGDGAMGGQGNVTASASAGQQQQDGSNILFAS